MIPGLEFEKEGHNISAQEAFFRGNKLLQICRNISFSRGPSALWKYGRRGGNSFLKAAELSDGLIEFVEIPFEDTALPGYICKVDNSGTKRPFLIIQTGLDGTVEDLYFYNGCSGIKNMVITALFLKVPDRVK